VILLQAVLDLTGDRLDVRLGCAGTDDEKVSECGNFPQVERDDVLGFFVCCVFSAKFG